MRLVWEFQMIRNSGSGACKYGIKAAFLVCMLMLSLSSWAGGIKNISLMDAKDGDVLIIEADEALEYQIFDLDGPPRLVMSFPNATIEDSIVAIKGEGAGVTNLFPMKNELGVRLEVGLSEALSYEIEEDKHNLIVRFNASENESLANATKAVVKTIQVKDRGEMTDLTLKVLNVNASHNAFITNENSNLVVDFWVWASKL